VAKVKFGLVNNLKVKISNLRLVDNSYILLLLTL